MNQELLDRAHARLVVCRDLTDDAQLDCEVIRDLLAALRESQKVWTHEMMQEFVNEVQQHLTAGRTKAAFHMFECR